MVWSGIYPPEKDKPCDICKSDKDVCNEMVEVAQGGCVKSVFSHVQSSLCLICKANGWIIFGSGADHHGRISYYNTKTGKFNSELGSN